MKRTEATGSIGGQYIDRNTELGREGTLLTAEDRNAIQEELVGVIEASGQILNGGDLGQLLKAIVLKLGNVAETITGVKTFSDIPVLPAVNPTTDNQATRRAFVTGLDAQNVKLSGAQTIVDVKTFTSIPVGPAVNPTSGDQLTRKAYVDGLDAQNVKTNGAQTISGVKTFSDNLNVSGTLGVTGAISGATVNTGQGDFKIGQNLRTTDAPRFIEIYSGYVYSAGGVSLMSKSSVLSTQGFVEIQTATFEWDERLLGIFRFGGTATTASSSYSPIFTVKLYKNGALIHTKVQTTSKATEGFYVDIPLQDGDEIKAGIYISNSVPAGSSSATLTSLYLAVQERPDSILEASQVEKVASRWTATF